MRNINWKNRWLSTKYIVCSTRHCATGDNQCLITRTSVLAITALRPEKDSLRSCPNMQVIVDLAAQRWVMFALTPLFISHEVLKESAISQTLKVSPSTSQQENTGAQSNKHTYVRKWLVRTRPSKVMHGLVCGLWLQWNIQTDFGHTSSHCRHQAIPSKPKTQTQEHIISSSSSTATFHCQIHVCT